MLTRAAPCCPQFSSGHCYSLVGWQSSAPYEIILLLMVRILDESVTVYVVLRLSNCSEATLKTQLSRLDVQLDGFAVNTVEGGETPPAKELVFSGLVKETEDPLVVVNGFEGDEGDGNHVYVMWKHEAFIS